MTQPTEIGPTRGQIGDALHGSECPAPEVFLPREWAELAQAEQVRLRTHVTGCPACRVEQSLAESFDVPEVVAEAHVDARGLRLALAASVALFAAGLATWLVYDLGGSSSMRAPNGSVTRGSSLMLVTPDGPQIAPPADFVWSPVDDAVRYQVTVRSVAGDIVWSASANNSRVDATAAPNTPGVTWHWDVQAFDAGNAPLASSVQGVYSIKMEDKR